MLLRIAFFLAFAQVFCLPVSAQPAEELARLLRIDDLMVIMRDEGLEYGAEIEAELFPGAGGARWQQLVARIYDPASMQRRFDAEFGPDMDADPVALEASRSFFASERGRRIVDLELAARRAILDEAVEAAARSQADEMRRADDPLIEAIDRFATVNDLIEQNVAGALNASLAFYRGMAAGGAFEGGLTEGQILADVWTQEAEVRRETREWLFSYLTLAYQPLSEDDLQAYVAFSETPEGQSLNAAIFAGFTAVFNAVSQDLGLAAAQMMTGQDL